MNQLHAFLQSRHPSLAWIGLVMVSGVGFLDTLTGYELAFSLFYLAPIALSAWFGGRKFGIITAIASAISWYLGDYLAGRPYSNPEIIYWNTLIRFGVFLVVANLVAALKNALDHEQELARVDNLTGSVNRRFFSQLVEMEINRVQRNKEPFSVAYFDLDNFKYVNDHFGHTSGDRVLQATVTEAKKQLRKADIVARLGGDEFAILLPETGRAEAEVAISNLRRCLLDEMLRNNWPITYSIGVLTCLDVPESSDELIQRVDSLMYKVKKSGKNSITYAINTATGVQDD